MKRLIKLKPIWITLIFSLFIHFFLIIRFNDLPGILPNKKIMEKTHVARIFLKLKTEFSLPIENSGVSNLKSIPDFQNIENRDSEKQIFHMEEKTVKGELSVEEIVFENTDKKEIIRSPAMKKMRNQEKITEDFTKKDIPEQVTEEKTTKSTTEIGKKINQIKGEPEKEMTLNKITPGEKVGEEPLREDKENSMDNDRPDKNRKIKAGMEKFLATGNKETKKEIAHEKEQNIPGQSKKNNNLKGKIVQEDDNLSFLENDCKNEVQVKNDSKIEKALDFTGNSYPDNVDPPELFEFQPPAYPKNLRERDIEGKVMLKVLIDTEGKVGEIYIFKSSGYEMFDQIAIKSVKQWRFQPAKKENRQRESWVLIPINFQIK